MSNEYKTICDTCGKRTWYEEEQACHMSYAKGATCDMGHYHEEEPYVTERCKGTLRVIDYTNTKTHLVTVGERYTFQDKRGVQKRFTVGKTTGWKPCLLLLHNARSTGSSRTINAPEIKALGGGVYEVDTYFD